MSIKNENDDEILVVKNDDSKKIEEYHSKWYGAYKINLTDELIKELEKGNILLYNNDEYSFEIKKSADQKSKV